MEKKPDQDLLVEDHSVGVGPYQSTEGRRFVMMIRSGCPERVIRVGEAYFNWLWFKFIVSVDMHPRRLEVIFNGKNTCSRDRVPLKGALVIQTQVRDEDWAIKQVAHSAKDALETIRDIVTSHASNILSLVDFTELQIGNAKINEDIKHSVIQSLQDTKSPFSCLAISRSSFQSEDGEIENGLLRPTKKALEHKNSLQEEAQLEDINKIHIFREQRKRGLDRQAKLDDEDVERKIDKKRLAGIKERIMLGKNPNAKDMFLLLEYADQYFSLKNKEIDVDAKRIDLEKTLALLMNKDRQDLTTKLITAKSGEAAAVVEITKERVKGETRSHISFADQTPEVLPNDENNPSDDKEGNHTK